MASRKVILVLDLGSSSGRALVFSLPAFEVIGTARFEVSAIARSASDLRRKINFSLEVLSLLFMVATKTCMNDCFGKNEHSNCHCRKKFPIAKTKVDKK